jgi:hypothetical protein
MKKLTFAIIAITLFGFIGCDDTPATDCVKNLDFEVYPINLSETYGFDDYGSPGAALGIAIDNSKNTALIVALKFNLPLYSKSFIPNCNPIETTETYFYSLTNSLTDSLADNYTYLAPLLTNTYGIRSMDNNISAFLVIKGETPELDQYFVAVDGNVTLNREDGGNILEGDLKFAPITEASENAQLQKNGEAYKVNNIYMQWDTENQPD